MSLSLTKKDLANIAGYTYRRLYDIDRDLPVEKKLFVEGEDGKYDLAIFVQHWVDYNVEVVAPDAGFDLEVVKAKHEAIKTQKTELEVAKLRGQLIDINDVRRLWGDLANTVVQNLIHLPNKLAPVLRMQDSTEIIREIIDAEIRRVLEGIAKTPVPDYADEETDDNDEEDGESESDGTG